PLHALGRQRRFPLRHARQPIRVELGCVRVDRYEQDGLLPALSIRIDFGCPATAASGFAVPHDDHHVAAVNDRTAREFIGLFSRSGRSYYICDGVMPLPELVEPVDRLLGAEVTTVFFYRQWENNL